MKIYTKGGDKGTTALWGGKRVSKANLRIDAYGTVDELNVHIGLVKDVINDAEIEKLLLEVQGQLFVMGALLSADPEKSGLKLPELNLNAVQRLEDAIDSMETMLEPLSNFILPGGHVYVSYVHLARVVCRRAERLTVALAEVDKVNPTIIIYLNRLSDYLFVLSRIVAKKLDIKERPWLP